MYKPGTFMEQNMIVIECSDCKESRSTICAICKDFVCNRHQKKMQGYVVPESFNHGTSAQRQTWLARGYLSGAKKPCMETLA